jgi:ribonuclease P protein component
VSRKVGNAVIRNLVKRRLRAWFRSARVRLPQGMDWVVIARSTARKASFPAMVRELDQLTGALGRSHG